ncbi:MAG: hypothetical protein AAB692_03300 [Patescibacteria group bacterium]
MGKYLRISLALFYSLQLLVTFQNSLVLLFEGAADMARFAVPSLERPSDQDHQRPPHDSLVRRSLFFLRRAFGATVTPSAALSVGVAVVWIDNRFSSSQEGPEGNEIVDSAAVPKKERLAFYCIRNLFNEILKRPIPAGCEDDHACRRRAGRTPRTAAA